MQKRHSIGLFIMGGLLGCVCFHAPSPSYLRPGHPDWPTGWVSGISCLDSLESLIPRLKQSGIGCIGIPAKKAAGREKEILHLCKKSNIKIFLEVDDTSSYANKCTGERTYPVPALMIGGVFQGRAIDRNVFQFQPKKQKIRIESPLLYSRSRSAETSTSVCSPVRAEVVVPLALFDGCQHLFILPAEITSTNEKQQSTDTNITRSFDITFDLSGLEGALLDKIGLAVYWTMNIDSDQRLLPTSADSRWQQERYRHVRNTLASWKQGRRHLFPIETIPAIQIKHLNHYFIGQNQYASTSIPLWDYSGPAVEIFYHKTSGLEYPRTWGVPEIYGAEAYRNWTDTFFEINAKQIQMIQNAADSIVTGLLVLHPVNVHVPIPQSTFWQSISWGFIPEMGEAVQPDLSVQSLNVDMKTVLSFADSIATQTGKVLIPQIQLPDSIAIVKSMSWSDDVLQNLNIIRSDAVIWNDPGEQLFSNMDKFRDFHEQMRFHYKCE